MYMHNLRRTGRTTRMLNEARALVADSHRVYIVVPPRLILMVQQWCSQLEPREARNVTIASDVPEGYDWETMSCRGVKGSRSAPIVLIDHSVIETRFEALLDELHAYDAEE